MHLAPVDIEVAHVQATSESGLRTVVSENVTSIGTKAKRTTIVNTKTTIHDRVDVFTIELTSETKGGGKLSISKLQNDQSKNVTLAHTQMANLNLN